MEEQKRKSGMTGMERGGREAPKSVSGSESGRESEMEAGRSEMERKREPSYSSGSSSRRGTVGMEGEESPRPVTPGSQPETSSVYEGEEKRSTGTAGPTAQLSRKKGESERR